MTIVDKTLADSFRARCGIKVDVRPEVQRGLELAPWSIATSDEAAGAWVRAIREQACLGPKVAKRAAALKGTGRDCVVVKVQNHWQHTGYFQRYGQFIRDHVFMSSTQVQTFKICSDGGSSCVLSVPDLRTCLVNEQPAAVVAP